MASPQIKSIKVGDRTRYRFRVDIGVDPQTGKRRQLTKTYDGKREAEKALAKILAEVNQGTYAGPNKVTVEEYLSAWLRSATRGKSPNTDSAYRHGLQPARDRLGSLPLQKLSTAHVEDLVDWMLTGGRRRGGKPRHSTISASCADHPLSESSRLRSMTRCIRGSWRSTWPLREVPTATEGQA